MLPHWRRGCLYYLYAVELGWLDDPGLENLIDLQPLVVERPAIDQYWFLMGPLVMMVWTRACRFLGQFQVFIFIYVIASV